MNCLREPMSAMIDAAWPASPHLGNSRPSHQAIADAVRAGDAAASRRAMQAHLDEMTQELRKVKLLP
jgi:DNA-binding FadR family transcriptional regulator